MSARLGGVLLAGGVAGVAAGMYAPLQPKQKQLALYGGGAAAAVGLVLLLRAAKDAGGLFAALGSIVSNREKPLVESVQTLAPAFEIKATGGAGVPATPQQAIEAGRPGQFVIPLVVEIVTPTEDSTVNPSLFAGDYKLTVRITNATNAPIEDVLTLDVVEDYAIGQDERASASQVVRVPAKQSVLVELNVPIGGGAVRYSRAYAVATVRFRGFSDLTGYQIVP